VCNEIALRVDVLVLLRLDMLQRRLDRRRIYNFHEDRKRRDVKRTLSVFRRRKRTLDSFERERIWLSMHHTMSVDVSRVEE
jgi:hypothetical protein